MFAYILTIATIKKKSLNVKDNGKIQSMMILCNTGQQRAVIAAIPVQTLLLLRVHIYFVNVAGQEWNFNT